MKPHVVFFACAFLGFLAVANAQAWHDLIEKKAHARTRVITPHVVNIDVRPDPEDGFSPSSIVVDSADTLHFRDIDWDDNIVVLGDGTGERCNKSAAWAAATDNLAIVPNGWGGIIVRGPAGDAAGGGPEIVDPFTCTQNPGPSGSYPIGIAGCCDVDAHPTVVGSRAYCNGQVGEAAAVPAEMYAYPGLAAVLVIIPWHLYETSDGVFDETTFDVSLNRAMWSGKRLILSFDAADLPSTWWGFENNGGTVTRVHLKDNISSTPGPNNCGSDKWAGSPADADYVTQYQQLITHVANHVKTKSGWVRSIGGWQLGGIHNQSDEFKMPKSCMDTTPKDGILDTYNGDACICNVQQWATAGVNQQVMVDWTVNQRDFVHSAFWPELDVRVGLIQGGYAEASSPTNFKGDSLCTAGTTAPCTFANMICPTCGTSPANAAANDNLNPSSVGILNAMIAATIDTGDARMMWCHFGLGPLPLEDIAEQLATQNCSWGGTFVAANTPPITFPIPLRSKDISSELKCPNPWAVNQTIRLPRPHLGCFQSNNEGNLNPDGGNGAHTHVYESVLANGFQNSNVESVDLYSQMLFENHETNGSAGDMDPTRETTPLPAGYDPAWTKSYSEATWNQMYRARRQDDIMTTVYGEAYPDDYVVTLTTGGVTHLLTNMKACGQTGTGAPLLTITVNP